MSPKGSRNSRLETAESSSECHPAIRHKRLLPVSKDGSDDIEGKRPCERDARKALMGGGGRRKKRDGRHSVGTKGGWLVGN